jgi:hypothetical protein
MIDDLLEVTRLETGKLTIEAESVSVADAVNDCCNTLRESALAKGLTLTWDVPPGLPPAHADQTRLRQILIILLDNAVKFTPQGGSVKVAVRLCPGDPSSLLMEVADTGRGMSPEMAAKAFDRLSQESEAAYATRKGVGLGLFICKELVIQQGGHICVKSQLGLGSTFSFTLPVFSLSNSIAPLLKDGKWPRETVALITAEIRSSGLWFSDETQREWSLEIRSMLQGCLLPNLDVLLPKMSYGAARERFFIAAFADAKGASVLADRIREQFERLSPLRRGDLTLAVEYTMLKPFVLEDGSSPADLLAMLAASLEASIRSQIMEAV